jgi:hypothetical protein
VIFCLSQKEFLAGIPELFLAVEEKNSSTRYSKSIVAFVFPSERVKII